MKDKNNSAFWQGVSYVAACAAIGYACKVTKSGKPLWAFLLIGFPKFIGTEGTPGLTIDISKPESKDEATKENTNE